MEVLFTFLAERYERKSVMITTNLVFSEWERIFKDPMTTMAAIDRLVHHSVILDMMSVESYRAEEASQQRLLSSPPKKASSRRTPFHDAGASLPPSEASSAVTSPLTSKTTPAHLFVAGSAPAHFLVVEGASEDPLFVDTTSARVIAADGTI
jgi:IstB-like ATP binding protein